MLRYKLEKNVACINYRTFRRKLFEKSQNLSKHGVENVVATATSDTLDANTQTFFPDRIFYSNKRLTIRKVIGGGEYNEKIHERPSG